MSLRPTRCTLFRSTCQFCNLRGLTMYNFNDIDGEGRRRYHLKCSVIDSVHIERLSGPPRPTKPIARLPRSWTLLYSLDQHDISLNTLYARCQDFKGSALLIVRHANNAVDGLLWKIMGKDRVRVYEWTCENDYVTPHCESDYIPLAEEMTTTACHWLHETLSEGASARCPMFNNEPLCSAGLRQDEPITSECIGLEV
ncbi:hypothetical protein C8Q73DRAFT_214775 [Cubamyces lactineus]|nr:hypothetical protein C8Q73DRAFT_214775 [Cubamyces lactineus]